MAELQWVAASGGAIPDGAYDIDGQYVARAHHDGGVIIGPVNCSEGCCTIGYCGETFNRDEYEVLMRPTDDRRLRWEPYTQGEIPAGSVKGGYLCSGHELYVARAWQNEELVVGHVDPVNRRCCIPLQGQCFDCDEFQLLVEY